MSDTPDEDRLMTDTYHRMLPAAGECEDAQAIAFMRGWQAGRDWAREQVRPDDDAHSPLAEGE